VTCSANHRLNPVTVMPDLLLYASSTLYALLLLAGKHGEVSEAVHDQIRFYRAGLRSKDLLVFGDSAKDQ